MDEENRVDPPLSTEQQYRVNELSTTQLQIIDEALLENTSTDWRKVARIVGTTMTNFGEAFKGIPDVFYAQRIKTLVERGEMQSQGNLDRMRYSEVKRIEESS